MKSNKQATQKKQSSVAYAPPQTQPHTRGHVKQRYTNL